jgi:hypothetical protein
MRQMESAAGACEPYRRRPRGEALLRSQSRGVRIPASLMQGGLASSRRSINPVSATPPGAPAGRKPRPAIEAVLGRASPFSKHKQGPRLSSADAWR